MNSDIIKIVESEILRNNIDDYSILTYQEKEKMVRFYNNNVSISKNLENSSIEIYIGHNKKRILGSISNLDKTAIESFVQNLIKSCELNPVDKDYIKLSESSIVNSHAPDYDKLDNYSSEFLVDLTHSAINKAIELNIERAAGSLTCTETERTIKTSANVEHSEKSTDFLFNVRTFSNQNSSGHGLSCSTTMKDLNVEEATITASNFAVDASNPKPGKPGIYDLIFTPTVSADIIQFIGDASSAFSVDAGMSFLENQLDKKVSNENFSITDCGIIKNGLHSRSFDDEGSPTGNTEIIKNGMLKNLLHNNTTSNKHSVNNTGNAGIIDPTPWNIVVDQGDSNLDEMIKETTNGIFVTNNWYTRFQNPRDGTFSTVPRDAAFIVKNGKLDQPIKDIRISDSITRIINNIELISDNRSWIKWWEVETPVYSPILKIKNVPITSSSS